METDITNKKATEYSSLALAYLGDAVYELYIRNRLLKQGNFPVDTLHKTAIRYVQAGSQSAAVTALLPELTDEELQVYKRGRNAKPATLPKHANAGDYHRATGFEALVGYLYLEQRYQRLEILMEKAFAFLEQKAEQAHF